jgi:hypothetical protein
MTKEEMRDYKREYNKDWRKRHADYDRKYHHDYYLRNKEKIHDDYMYRKEEAKTREEHRRAERTIIRAFLLALIIIVALACTVEAKAMDTTPLGVFVQVMTTPEPIESWG